MIYDGVPLETLREQLALAQAALPLLSRGEAIGAIATGDKRITFVASSPASLKQHIADLQRAILALENPADAGHRMSFAVAVLPEC